MFRLNGAYFYNGGAQLQAVRSIPMGTKFVDITQAVWAAEEWLGQTLTAGIFHLRTSFSAGMSLLDELRSLKKRIEDAYKKGCYDEAVGWEINSLAAMVEKFTTLLTAELAVSDFYFVTSKGCFDTTRLIDSGVDLFTKDLADKVPDAIRDCVGAGRCIAFDLPTAAAFHLHRLNETVLRVYFNFVAPNVPHPESRTIRAYVEAMKSRQVGNKKVHSALSSLNSLHRNPVMHPDQSLDTVEEAIALWGSVNACVLHMLKEIPPPPLELTLSPNGQQEI
jgi:hypothetical protein